MPAAAGLPDLLGFFHELILRRAPRGDHGVQIFCGSAHGFDFCFAATLLSRNVEAKRLAMTSDRERVPAFEVTRQVLAELTHANLSISAYSVYARTCFGVSRPAEKPANWLQKRLEECFDSI